MADGSADFTPETLELARDTMKGQLRDLVLDHMKHEKKNSLPWNLWPEEEQQGLIDRVEMAIGHAITQVVQIIARDGKRSIVADVDQVTIKGALKVTLKAARTEPNLLALGNHVGATVLITVADDEAYQGGQDRKPEQRQGDIFNGDEDDDKPVFDNTPSGDK